MAAHLSPGGRFDTYDPQEYRNTQRDPAGIPDLNILAKLPSVAGYGSIVNGNYNSLTLTHTPGELNVPQLGEGRLKELDLHAIVSLPEYFLVPLATEPARLQDVSQISESTRSDAVLPLGNKANFVDSSYPYYPAPRGGGSAGHVASWFFGASLRPSRVRLLLAAGRRAGPSCASIGHQPRWGDAKWGRPVTGRGWRSVVDAALPSGRAVGLSVQVVFGPGASVPACGDRRRVDQFELDGSLSSALAAGCSGRTKGSRRGLVTLFVRTSTHAGVHGARVGGQDTVTVNLGVGAMTNVETHPAAGRSAVHGRGARRGLGPRLAGDGPGQRGTDQDWSYGAAHGLVQQVRVPAGDDVVTFRYRPPHLVLAAVLSLGGALVLLIVLLAVTGYRLVRRKRGRVEPVSRLDAPASAGTRRLRRPTSRPPRSWPRPVPSRPGPE